MTPPDSLTPTVRTAIPDPRPVRQLFVMLDCDVIEQVVKPS
ncbi:hypothetical protein GN958_ATG10511, partial [Phytophthora infestans]